MLKIFKKLNFDTRMKEAAKNLASKSEVDGALDIAHFFEEKKSKNTSNV